jgi:hypothetical protein
MAWKISAEMRISTPLYLTHSSFLIKDLETNVIE